MISALAVIPSPPFLLPEYAGRIDPDPVLRSACEEVVGVVAAEADRVLAIVATDPDRRHSGDSVGRRVAATFLGRIPDDVLEVPWDASREDCRALGAAAVEGHDPTVRLGVVVVADGCATRTEKAPGHLDRRALDVDAAWTKAVGADEFRCVSPAAMGAAQGTEIERFAFRPHPQDLLRLDPGLAADLWFVGRAPLQALAGALIAADTDLETERFWVGDPFGVRYVVLAAR